MQPSLSELIAATKANVTSVNSKLTDLKHDLSSFSESFYLEKEKDAVRRRERAGAVNAPRHRPVSSWHLMPLDVLELIFFKLPTTSCLQLMCVCRRLLSVCESEELWQGLCSRLERSLSTCPGMTSREWYLQQHAKWSQIASALSWLRAKNWPEDPSGTRNGLPIRLFLQRVMHQVVEFAPPDIAPWRRKYLVDNLLPAALGLCGSNSDLVKEAAVSALATVALFEESRAVLERLGGQRSLAKLLRTTTCLPVLRQTSRALANLWCPSPAAITTIATAGSTPSHSPFWSSDAPPRPFLGLDFSPMGTAGPMYHLRIWQATANSWAGDGTDSFGAFVTVPASLSSAHSLRHCHLSVWRARTLARTHTPQPQHKVCVHTRTRARTHTHT